MKISFFKSLRVRFLIVLLGLAALPALLIGGLAYRNAREAIIESSRAKGTIDEKPK